ncbi:hypothetical protein F5148DRAFT_1145450 [Russula earlei]|uniref:Uncharacterized protein n=1 Tax=Russula earlei TaxID=71964 RepID=A0ACC0UP69_9AGAM|nr:hypothetical protein F5148DRAFT_1145450 [Russula earlei]
MSHIPSTASSSSNFLAVFNAALETYEKKTKSKLLTHPLAAQLQLCDSPDAILSVLQHLVQQFDQRGSGDSRLRDWLNPTVNILYTFSAVIGSGVALIYSPANVIFAGIGVLLLVAKDVDASHETLIDIFKRMEHFFKRLESYMAVSSTTGMTQVIVEILVEVLGILAIATKEVKERLPKVSEEASWQERYR